MTKTLCPCNSNIEFELCCNQYISGNKLPETALLLMKSRYSAFATANADYLNKTSVSKQTSKDLATWAKSNTWKSLEILNTTQGQEIDSSGTVEFRVLYNNSDKQLIEHLEKSTFIKNENQWMYDTGEVKVNVLPNSNISIGRNDPCTCGSGKKFKKCCG